MDDKEKEYKKFNKLLKSGNYSNIINCMKILYTDKYIFEYVFSRYYSCSRNPFTTAYHEFMNNYISGMDIDEIFEIIAKGILQRYIHERKSKNKYITFKEN